MSTDVLRDATHDATRVKRALGTYLESNPLTPLVRPCEVECVRCVVHTARIADHSADRGTDTAR